LARRRSSFVSSSRNPACELDRSRGTVTRPTACNSSPCSSFRSLGNARGGKGTVRMQLRGKVHIRFKIGIDYPVGPFAWLPGPRLWGLGNRFSGMNAVPVALRRYGYTIALQKLAQPDVRAIYLFRELTHWRRPRKSDQAVRDDRNCLFLIPVHDCSLAYNAEFGVSRPGRCTISIALHGGQRQPENQAVQLVGQDVKLSGDVPLCPLPPPEEPKRFSG
jgi:hypothetical protein